MQLVEQHIISKGDPRYQAIDQAAFASKNLYNAQLVGIRVILTEESYTSKCSFLDLEPIGKHERYMGKRVHRGLFRSADGHCYHADVNGSYNIIRKVVPDAFGKGIVGTAVYPCRLAIAV